MWLAVPSAIAAIPKHFIKNVLKDCASSAIRLYNFLQSWLHSFIMKGKRIKGKGGVILLDTILRITVFFIQLWVVLFVEVSFQLLLLVFLS